LTFARNVPLLGGMYVLKLPVDVVAVVSAHFQPPFVCFWMTTRTIERQAESPFETFTCPETRLFGWNLNPVTVRPTGAVVTVKSAVLVTVPPGVVSEILPVVAPEGTTAVTDVDVFDEKLAVVPLNLTDDTLVRPVPVMTTLVPTGPLVGVNDVIVGRGATVKLVELLTWEKPDVVTRTGPVVAPVGTIAVICVAEFTVTLVAVVELNTTVAPQRFVPVMMTLVPTGPLTGKNEPIVGAVAAVTSKLAALSSFPSVFATLMGPSTAPHGTTAVN